MLSGRVLADTGEICIQFWPGAALAVEFEANSHVLAPPGSNFKLTDIPDGDRVQICQSESFVAFGKADSKTAVTDVVNRGFLFGSGQIDNAGQVQTKPGLCRFCSPENRVGMYHSASLAASGDISSVASITLFTKP